MNNLNINCANENEPSPPDSLSGMEKSPKSQPQSVPYHERTQGNPVSEDVNTRRKTIVILVTIVFAFVLVGLDQNIIATAVPAMTADFKTISDVGWYNSVYRLTSSSFQPLAGKIYSLFPARRAFLISLFLFACGTLLCALAPSSSAFIVGRALTGAATAGIISGAFASITLSFPLEKRSIYAGIGGGSEAIAGVCAPLLGGLLTDHLSWRWCFFVQLPFILLTFVLVATCCKQSQDVKSVPFREKVSRLDLFGTATFVPAITSLLMAVQYGGGKYGWSNWRVVLLFNIFVMLLAAFCYLQYRRQDRATLPPGIILRRTVLLGVWFSFCNNGALSVIEYYMPIYFQAARCLTATKSGVMLLPIIVGLVISVVLSGYLTSIVGYYTPFMLLTSVISPIATGLLTTITPSTQTWKLIIFQGLLGIGVGVGFQGPQVAVQTILTHGDIPIGLAVIQFAQGIGPAIFTAVAQSIFLAQLRANKVNFSAEGGTNVPSIDETCARVRGVVLDNLKSASIAYGKSLVQTFHLPLVLSCLTVIGSLGMEWRNVKREEQQADPDTDTATSSSPSDTGNN